MFLFYISINYKCSFKLDDCHYKSQELLEEIWSFSESACFRFSKATINSWLGNRICTEQRNRQRAKLSRVKTFFFPCYWAGLVTVVAPICQSVVMSNWDTDAPSEVTVGGTNISFHAFFLVGQPWNIFTLQTFHKLFWVKRFLSWQQMHQLNWTGVFYDADGHINSCQPKWLVMLLQIMMSLMTVYRYLWDFFGWCLLFFKSHSMHIIRL